MTRLPYKIPRSRGANSIIADPDRLESKDGKRWATGRNVKVSIGPGRYDSVRVYRLKMRNEQSKVVTIAHDMSREDAVKWCSPKGLEHLARWVNYGF